MDLDHRENYRPNVGIVIINEQNLVFLGKRTDKQVWQFPQGGILPNEAPDEALFRELYEEVGLQPNQVEVLTEHPKWLSYDFVTPMKREDGRFYKGQLQKWFLLRFNGQDTDINVAAHNAREFDDWCWTDFWKPLEEVVDFKKATYSAVLEQFAFDLGIPKEQK